MLIGSPLEFFLWILAPPKSLVELLGFLCVKSWTGFLSKCNGGNVGCLQRAAIDGWQRLYGLSLSCLFSLPTPSLFVIFTLKF